MELLQQRALVVSPVYTLGSGMEVDADQEGMMDAERVAHRVHNLCSTIEALGQELQDAEAENERARRWAGTWKRAAKAYRRMAQEQIELRHDIVIVVRNWALREDNKRLREALDAFIEAEYSAAGRSLGHPITVGLLSRAAELAHAAMKGDGDG